MAMVDSTRKLEPRAVAPIGWDGSALKDMLTESERLLAETGHYCGFERLELKDSDPIGYEKLFSRIRGGLVSARESAMNISASPIVRELGELCFALYTPEGDSIALSTGIIVHVHTMSDAIKYMVRSDYERNPKIRPGDIFANNSPQIGNVHNADVQTFVPIFWEDELVAWAGGVTHVVDIGSSTAGGVPVGPTTRYEDGIDLHCAKVGEDDELAHWHLKRGELMNRAPMYYMLDERTRLAGCHMVRSAVERVILEEGVDVFKQFSREVIEEGRRSFKSRIREMTVPGRYRCPAFIDVSYGDKQEIPARGRRDIMMHSPFEVRIGGDGTFALDMDGASAWGYHSMNCTPSSMQGAIWVQFTQTLICNDKVNDGAYLGITTNFPEGTWTNIADGEGSTGIAWAFLQPAFTGFPRTISRAVQSRGFIEEVLSSYSVSGNCIQGGGVDQFGNSGAILNFEIAAQGQGGKYVADGGDFVAAMFNPEGDMGDCESWELLFPFVYLSRRIKASTGGCGRHRGGASFESLVMCWNTSYWEMQNVLNGKVFVAAGIFGGYPGACPYIHNIRNTDILQRAADGDSYPLYDGDYERLALLDIKGDHELSQDSFTMLAPMGPGDLYLSVMRGGGGLGDPLLRPAEHVRQDVEEGFLLPRFAEDVYAISDREAVRRRRLERAEPTSQWWARERERVVGHDLIQPLQAMYAESMRLSPHWAAEFRGFWDLPEDFDFDVHTPTVAVEATSGRITPQEAARTFLEQSDVAPPEDDQGEALGRSTDQAALGDLLDERLSRRAVKDVQSGFKEHDRFDAWVAVLQERVDYEDPIVLPVGEGLNIVRRRSDGELVIRTDAGYDLCRWDENWKAHAVVFVRDTTELMREVYPERGHCDPEWMELREFYCPASGHMLEVEAVPPGYPLVHDFLPDVEGFYRHWLGRDLPS
jgi:N-methylhydantoinase B/acetone carboxylase alpha subunit